MQSMRALPAHMAMRAHESRAALRPFSRPWLAALESIVVGAPVPGGGPSCRALHLVCVEHDRVLPWMIEIADGAFRRVRVGLGRDTRAVVVHSVGVGWRLLGCAPHEFHRLDELVMEQFSGTRWRRHPMPPLDECAVDLSRPRPAGVIVWHERVIGSPLGTLFVSRRLADRRLWIFDASTRPPVNPAGVGSDVDWSDIMTSRGQGAPSDRPFRRFWRGPEQDAWAIRSMLLEDWDPARLTVEHTQRDEVWRDTMGALSALRDALGGNPSWRRLVRGST